MTNPEYWERSFAGAAVGGFIEFPGQTADFNNYVTVTTGAGPADANAEWRAEFIRPPAPASGNFTWSEAPLYIRGNVNGFQILFAATDATFPVVQVNYSTLNDGGSRVGELLQIGGDWDATTDTLSCLWRPGAGLDLLDDAGWNEANVGAAGKLLNLGSASWRFGGVTSLFHGVGANYRWIRRINGVLDVDVNPRLNLKTAGATSFTATTGQTVTVTRTGSPATKLVPPGVMWEPYDRYVGPVNVPDGAETIRSAMR